MIRRRVKNAGLTLVEVLIAVAFISLVYAFVIQLFFGGFKGINIGDVQEEAARLANNEMVRISSIENPLYIGLIEKDPTGDTVRMLKEGTMTPSQLVEQNLVTLGVSEIVGAVQDSENNAEIKGASQTRANYTRTVEWTVQDVDPVLVGIKVTVNWTDPRGEIQDGDVFLETQLSN